MISPAADRQDSLCTILESPLVRVGSPGSKVPVTRAPQGLASVGRLAARKLGTRVRDRTDTRRCL
jgi:hypothetical protein